MIRICLLIGCVTILLAGCQPKGDTKEQSERSSASILDDVQGEWQMLTEWGDQQWVMYRPCDADNRMIHVRSDTLLIGWGQDASLGLIKSFYRDEEGRTVLEVADLDMNERAAYAFRFEDEKRKLARWWLYEDELPDLFAHEDILDQYTVYEQPCSECWDDCEDQD